MLEVRSQLEWFCTWVGPPCELEDGSIDCNISRCSAAFQLNYESCAKIASDESTLKDMTLTMLAYMFRYPWLLQDGQKEAVGV